MKFLIIANTEKNGAAEIAEKTAAELRKSGAECAVYDRFPPDTARDIAPFFSEPDFYITVGGDGTILKWSKLAAVLKKPLLGINTGRLGFMTSLEKNELHLVSKLVSGEYTVSRRAMLDVRVGGEVYIALNDAVAVNTGREKMTEYIVSHETPRGRQEVLRISADGVIFSTATGSTAYSLAAGGPIAEPESTSLIFTPLCPHTLFSRSMIFSGRNPVVLECEPNTANLSVDGDEPLILKSGEKAVITLSELWLDLVEIGGESGGFYNAVHNKLAKPLKSGN